MARQSYKQPELGYHLYRKAVTYKLSNGGGSSVGSVFGCYVGRVLHLILHASTF